ncbi:MAG TPA: helix-turn-helix domain-containing protein, partial [Candidatus Lokiarchaeia archaeon]|nr:helix-turn-helix domain-containing protein [Candidatus Lokiarchaeia archaeon]
DIGRDETRDIGRDETRDVGRDETRDIGRDETRDIGRDETRDIGRDETRDIGRDETRDTGRDETHDIDSVQIELSISIPPKGTWLSRICNDYPDCQMIIISLLPIGPSGANVLIIFKGINVSRCVSKLRPEDGIVSYTILHEEKNKILANLQIDSTIFLHETMVLGIPIKYPIKVAAGKVKMQFITERWRIDELITNMNENGFTIEIQQIGPVKMTALLTETQENILTTALKKKFFDIPRGIKLHELASVIGMSSSSLSQDMRRIFKKLALNYDLGNDF